MGTRGWGAGRASLGHTARWGGDLSTGPRLGGTGPSTPVFQRCLQALYIHCFIFSFFAFFFSPLNLKRRGRGEGGQGREQQQQREFLSVRHPPTSPTLEARPHTAPHPLASVARAHTCQTHPRSFTQMQRTISLRFFFFFFFFLYQAVKKKKEKKKTKHPLPHQKQTKPKKQPNNQTKKKKNFKLN